MESGDDAIAMANVLQAMEREELARRIRKLLEAQGADALRRLTHPETGEPLRQTGVEAANPPRHETGSLSGKKR
jgi:acyl-CoA reductase-like NAD-dependent aldehyde dehydrogenase